MLVNLFFSQCDFIESPFFIVEEDKSQSGMGGYHCVSNFFFRKYVSKNLDTY